MTQYCLENKMTKMKVQLSSDFLSKSGVMLRPSLCFVHDKDQKHNHTIKLHILYMLMVNHNTSNNRSGPSGGPSVVRLESRSLHS